MSNVVSIIGPDLEADGLTVFSEIEGSEPIQLQMSKKGSFVIPAGPLSVPQVIRIVIPAAAPPVAVEPPAEIEEPVAADSSPREAAGE